MPIVCHVWRELDTHGLDNQKNREFLVMRQDGALGGG